MHIQRDFNVFADGVSLQLIAEGVTVPNVRDRVEEVSLGMSQYDVPVGWQKLEAGFKVNARNKELMKRTGLRPGIIKPFTFRSVNVSEIDGSQEDEIIQLTGRLNAEHAGWEKQGIPKDDYKIGSISYYRHVINGEVIHNIDLKNYVCVVDGFDHWAQFRSGLGF